MTASTLTRPVSRSGARPIPARRIPTGPAPRPMRAAAGPLRLTRRGRVVVVLALLGLLLGVGFTVGRASQSHAADAVTHTTVVRPGDTLWSIAARIAPDRDTRQVVAEISTANHLGSASLQVGQRLVVPS